MIKKKLLSNLPKKDQIQRITITSAFLNFPWIYKEYPSLSLCLFFGGLVSALARLSQIFLFFFVVAFHY